MSKSLFRVKEHILPSTHIREYPLATADSQEDVLHLAIKQYTPLDNSSPQRGDVTIIGAHANGFPKELYEPLWDEIYKRLKLNGIKIRSIWIADAAHQGQSSVLNEDKLGNDPSWFDHPRDLFLMVNHFRAQMPRPLIGVGHSMGGVQLTTLALMHPRLLSSLVLIDPVILRETNLNNFNLGRFSAVRRDRWPSRAVARTAFKKSSMFKTWDPRVLDLWVEHGLRELPTALYPDFTAASSTPPVLGADVAGSMVAPAADTEKEITLKTTKHQEVLTFMRSNFKTPSNPTPDTAPNLLTHPDVNLGTQPVSPFYRNESSHIFAQLQYLRPSVLWILGTESHLSLPEFVAEKMAVTGMGAGGSGGAEKGRVKAYTMEGGSHLMPMERVSETADQCSGWIEQELRRLKDEDEQIEKIRASTPKHKRAQMPDEYVRILFETGGKPGKGSKL